MLIPSKSIVHTNAQRSLWPLYATSPPYYHPLWAETKPPCWIPYVTPFLLQSENPPSRPTSPPMPEHKHSDGTGVSVKL